ncbi:hypothetical protein O0I10_000320 [Lichtheimia ornata]|uniref:VPS9 domain-containing protein n=1 Tax=Lichtheimia ornata TaxID=688661 RepID=A0AAD7Y570_9FUNG|nr:uncharacterized protein O0I10_000320 [Lichtheimia ornata]KAJ8664042.1 hypothetical protein O0I10_000320 [Lichtheimia ornata]
MHPLLEDVLKEPRLAATSPHIAIVLLPPIDTMPPAPCTLDFLASHVIVTLWDPTVESSASATAMPRPSLSASMLSRLSPKSTRRERSNSILDGLRSRSKSTLHDGNGGLSLSTVNNKPVLFHNRQITFGGNRTITIHHEDVVYNADDRVTHLLLYLEQPLCIQQETSTIPQNTQPMLPVVEQSSIKQMLSKSFNSSHRAVRQFCDAALSETNLGELHARMKDLLEEAFTYVDGYLDSALFDPTKSLSHDEAYKVCESHVMEETYDMVFFKITHLMQQMDEEVANVLDSMESLDFIQVGLPEGRTVRRRVERAGNTLRQIGTFRTPAEKLECLLCSITQLSESTDEDSDDELDSDALVSLLVLTLIRGQVAHLVANITYMKEFTFEQNLAVGRYGFAISTLEGVMQYILESRTHLASVARRNDMLWAAIKSGDLDLVVQVCGKHTTMERTSSSARISLSLPAVDITRVRDASGNNALMIAAVAGQTDIIKYLLQHHSPEDDLYNDRGETPLMLSVKSQCSTAVKLLLDFFGAQDGIRERDGNSAFLVACSLGNVDIMRMLLDHGSKWDTRNNIRQGPLHLAATHEQAIVYLLDQVNDETTYTWVDENDNTFLHLCNQPRALDHFISRCNGWQDILDMENKRGWTPLLTWAANGWFHMMETLLTHPIRHERLVATHDPEGRTALHLVANSLERKPTLGTQGLKYLVCHFSDLANVREWTKGNTPLHLAASLRILDSNRAFICMFIRHLVVDAGARIDGLNYRGARAGHICRDPEVLVLLDDVALEAAAAAAAQQEKHHMHPYAYQVTRATLIHQPTTTILYTIQSCAPGQRNEQRQRRLADFVQLRKDISHECPEAFLPTLRHLVDPEQVDLRPPPIYLREEAIQRLGHFMQWLQQHPTLQDHDLVRTFVRSKELKRETIETASFARRDLLLEKIGESFSSSGNEFGGSEDEEYFFSYSQSNIEALRDSLLGVILAGRQVIRCRRDLEMAMHQVVQGWMMGGNKQAMLTTMKVCAGTTGDTAFGTSLWEDTVQQFQTMHDLADGILMALQRPLWLLHRRMELREQLEMKRDHLRRVKSWNEVIPTQRRQIEQAKESVVETLSDLARTGSQIAQSHQVISDEMAHFQRVHPIHIHTAIRNFVSGQLARERYKLECLLETKRKLGKRSTKRG